MKLYLLIYRAHAHCICLGWCCNRHRYVAHARKRKPVSVLLPLPSLRQDGECLRIVLPLK